MEKFLTVYLSISDRDLPQNKKEGKKTENKLRTPKLQKVIVDHELDYTAIKRK